MTSVTDRFDGLAERYGKRLFASLWVREWGNEYPAELECYSSCTRRLLGQVAQRVLLVDGLVGEAYEIGPRLDDDRAWLLVTGVRRLWPDGA